MRIDLMERINPTVKAAVVILCCILMAAGGTWQINVAVIAAVLVCLVFFSRCSLKVMAGVYLPLLLLGGLIFLSSLLSGGASAGSRAVSDMSSFHAALLLGTRIMSYAGLGVLFGLTTDSKLFAMSLMQQLRLPPKFAYGVLAALYLVPTLRREWDEVQLAYAVRQKSTGPLGFRALFNTLVNGIRWSENVAMAMESKGFEGDSKRSFYVTTPVRTKDILFAAAGAAYMAVCILLLR